MSGTTTAVVVMDVLNTYDHEDAEAPRMMERNMRAEPLPATDCL